MAAHLAEILYKKMLADLDRRSILTGETRLMTEPVLSKHYGVAVGTIRKVVSRLVEENILERIQGCGTFLKSGRDEMPLSVSGLSYSAAFKLHCQSEMMIVFWILSYPAQTCFYGITPEELKKRCGKDLLFFSPLSLAR